MTDKEQIKYIITHKEMIPGDQYMMARLQQLAQFEKKKLLFLIQEKEILKELAKALIRVQYEAEHLDRKELPPGGFEEMLMQAATLNEPQMEQSEWTKAEARQVNQWWTKEFPEEENPLYLYEDELPETIEEPEEKTAAEKMTLADLMRLTR